MRARFFGPGGVNRAHDRAAAKRARRPSSSIDIDIRDARGCRSDLFAEHAKTLELVIHTAAQPSHDWAASDPQTDFGVNAQRHAEPARGDARQHAPTRPSSSARRTRSTATCPNQLPLIDTETRLELPRGSPLLSRASIRRCRSIVPPTRCSASPRPRPTCWSRSTAATSTCRPSCFRGGCLTGPNHAGAQLHGFLSYLMRVTMTGEPYTVFGYNGKQVRDNIHSADLVAAFDAFHRAPRSRGGLQHRRWAPSNCSMLEAIELCEEIAGRELHWQLSDQNRIGDHRWWISDLEPFQARLPGLGHPLRHRGRSCGRSTSTTPSSG